MDPFPTQCHIYYIFLGSFILLCQGYLFLLVIQINFLYIVFLVEDEGRGRYNLATKVMSNGVEVIIALDKSTLPGSPQLLRVLPTAIRPITLTPSTVTDHMIMMLPHGLQVCLL